MPYPRNVPVADLQKDDQQDFDAFSKEKDSELEQQRAEQDRREQERLQRAQQEAQARQAELAQRAAVVAAELQAAQQRKDAELAQFDAATAEQQQRLQSIPDVAEFDRYASGLDLEQAQQQSKRDVNEFDKYASKLDLSAPSPSSSEQVPTPVSTPDEAVPSIPTSQIPSFTSTPDEAPPSVPTSAIPDQRQRSVVDRFNDFTAGLGSALNAGVQAGANEFDRTTIAPVRQAVDAGRQGIVNEFDRSVTQPFQQTSDAVGSLLQPPDVTTPEQQADEAMVPRRPERMGVSPLESTPLEDSRGAAAALPGEAARPTLLDTARKGIQSVGQTVADFIAKPPQDAAAIADAYWKMSQEERDAVINDPNTPLNVRAEFKVHETVGNPLMRTIGATGVLASQWIGWLADEERQQARANAEKGGLTYRDAIVDANGKARVETQEEATARLMRETATPGPTENFAKQVAKDSQALADFVVAHSKTASYQGDMSDWKKYATDPEFWRTEGITQLGPMAALMPISMLIFLQARKGGASALEGAVSRSPTAQRIFETPIAKAVGQRVGGALESLGERSAFVKRMINTPVGKVAGELGVDYLAATISRTFESATEAGSAWADALKSGKSDAEAVRLGKQVWLLNETLSGQDLIQNVLMLGAPGMTPMMKRELGASIRSGLGELGTMGLRIAATGVSEGGEEVVQEAIQQGARGEDFHWTPEMEQSFVMGAAMGAVPSIPSAVREHVPAAVQNVRESVRRKPGETPEAQRARLIREGVNIASVAGAIGAAASGDAATAAGLASVPLGIAGIERVGEGSEDTAIVDETLPVAKRPSMPMTAVVAAAKAFRADVTPAQIANMPAGQAMDMAARMRYEAEAGDFDSASARRFSDYVDYKYVRDIGAKALMRVAPNEVNALGSQNPRPDVDPEPEIVRMLGRAAARGTITEAESIAGVRRLAQFDDMAEMEYDGHRVRAFKEERQRMQQEPAAPAVSPPTSPAVPPEAVQRREAGIPAGWMRVSDEGDQVGEGLSTFQTATGRSVPPAPEIPWEPKKVTTDILSRYDRWLYEQGIAEAESRNDTAQAKQWQSLRANKTGLLPENTKRSIREYVFGEPNPEWQTGNDGLWNRVEHDAFPIPPPAAPAAQQRSEAAGPASTTPQPSLEAVQAVTATLAPKAPRARATAQQALKVYKELRPDATLKSLRNLPRGGEYAELDLVRKAAENGAISRQDYDVFASYFDSVTGPRGAFVLAQHAPDDMRRLQQGVTPQRVQMAAESIGQLHANGFIDWNDTRLAIRQLAQFHDATEELVRSQAMKAYTEQRRNLAEWKEKQPPPAAPARQETGAERNAGRRAGAARPITTIQTQSGRNISAPPQVRLTSNRTVIKDRLALDEWLLAQGIAEAESRGDDFNGSRWRSERDMRARQKQAGELTQSTREDINEYMFGEPEPQWREEPNGTLTRIETGVPLAEQPRVQPPLLRPLVRQSTPQGAPSGISTVAPESVPAERGGTGAADQTALDRGSTEVPAGPIDEATGREGAGDRAADDLGGAAAPPTRTEPIGVVAASDEGSSAGDTVAPLTDPTPADANTYAWGNYNRQKMYPMRVRIVELDSLIPSQTDLYGDNPAYNKDFQPRDRDSDASRDQVEGPEGFIARWNPVLFVEDIHRLNDGPSIIGPDNMVESGNGRIMALRRARSDYRALWQAYQDALRAALPNLNLPPTAMDGLRFPVVVRERTQPMTHQERIDFTVECGAGTGLGMRTAEKARVDARNLREPLMAQLAMRDGQLVHDALLSADNRAFVSDWIESFGANERAEIQDSEGALSEAGVARLIEAVRAFAYRGPNGQEMLRRGESTDVTMKNTLNSTKATAPQMARLAARVRQGQRQPGLDIAEDLATAYVKLSGLRSNTQTPNANVDTYLHQTGFVERETTPFQDVLIELLNRHASGARYVPQLLQAYIRRADEAGNPMEPGMFDTGPTTKEDLLRDAAAEVSPKDIGLFADLEPEPVAPPAARTEPETPAEETPAAPAPPAQPPREPAAPPAAQATPEETAGEATLASPEVELDRLRRELQRDTHSLEDVASGRFPVGVEGRGGRDYAEAQRRGLYTTTVGDVPIFARTEADARPLVEYLQRGGRYGTPVFSRLLGYTEPQIDTYNRFLALQQQVTEDATPAAPTTPAEPTAYARSQIDEAMLNNWSEDDMLAHGWTKVVEDDGATIRYTPPSRPPSSSSPAEPETPAGPAEPPPADSGQPPVPPAPPPRRTARDDYNEGFERSEGFEAVEDERLWDAPSEVLDAMRSLRDDVNEGGMLEGNLYIDETGYVVERRDPNTGDGFVTRFENGKWSFPMPIPRNEGVPLPLLALNNSRIASYQNATTPPSPGGSGTPPPGGTPPGNNGPPPPGNQAPLFSSPSNNPWDGLSEARQKALRQMANGVGKAYLRMMVQRSPADPQGKVDIVVLSQSASEGTLLVRGIDEAGKLVSPPTAQPTLTTLWDVIFEDSVGDAALKKWARDKWPIDASKGQARLDAWLDHQLTKLAILYGREKALDASQTAAEMNTRKGFNIVVPQGGWKQGKSGVYVPEQGRLVNIKLADFDPEVGQQLKDLLNDPKRAALFNELADLSRRGVVPQQQTHEEALKIIQAHTDGSPDGVVLERLIREWQPGINANAETQLAVFMLLAEQLTEKKGLGVKAAAGAATQAELITLAQYVKTTPALLMLHVGLRAEAGRGLNIYNSLRSYQNFRNAVGSGDIRKIQTALKYMTGKNWTLNDKWAEILLSDSDFDDPVAFMRRMRLAMKPTDTRYIEEAYIQALLTGTGSSIINVTTGGFSIGVVRPAEMFVAGAVDKALAAIAGRPRTRFIEESFQYMMSPRAALHAGLEAAMYFYRNGFSQDFAKGLATGDQKFMERPMHAIPHRIGVLPVPTTWLEMGDQFLKGIATTGMKQAIVYRTARISTGQRSGPALWNEVARLMAQPTNAIEKELAAAIEAEAASAADYSLWRSQADKVVQNLLALRELGNRPNDTEREPGILPRIGDVIRDIPSMVALTQLPFIRTPANIAKWNAERIPVLAMLNPWMLFRVLTKEDPKRLQKLANAPKQLQDYRKGITDLQGKTAERAASAIVASVGAAVIWSLVEGGLLIVTGAPPDDPAEKERWARDGWQAYSINIAGLPYWIEYRRIEGLNTVMNTVAIAQEEKRKGSDFATTLARMGGGALEMFANQTYIAQIGSIFNLALNGSRYGDTFLRRYIAQMAMPVTIVRQSVGLFDPTMREGKTLSDAVQRNIPGLSQNATPQMDVWGNPTERLLPGLVPIRVSEERGGTVEIELARLKVTIGQPGDTIDKVKLFPDEVVRYRQLAGRYTRERLNKNMQNPKYRSLNDEEKIAVIRGSRSAARDQAAAEIMKGIAKNRYPAPTKKDVEKVRELVRP
jgi:hypothetical protein